MDEELVDIGIDEDRVRKWEELFRRIRDILDRELLHPSDPDDKV